MRNSLQLVQTFRKTKRYYHFSSSVDMSSIFGSQIVLDIYMIIMRFSLLFNYIQLTMMYQNERCGDIFEKYSTFSNQNKCIWLIKCIYFTYLKICSYTTNTWWWQCQWIWIKCERNLKSPDVYIVGRTIPKLLMQLNVSLEIYVGNSLDKSIEIFNEYFALCSCIPVVYKYVPILIRIASCTSDIHPLCVAQYVCISSR